MSPAAAFVLVLTILALIIVVSLIIIDMGQRIIGRVREARRRASLLAGDCLDVLAEMPEASVDSDIRERIARAGFI